MAGGTSLMSTGVGVSGSPETSSAYRDTTPRMSSGWRAASSSRRPSTDKAGAVAPVISASRAFACSTSSVGRDFLAARDILGAPAEAIGQLQQDALDLFGLFALRAPRGRC